MKILVAHLDDITVCPPVYTAVQLLLELGYNVTLITYNVDKLAVELSSNSKLECINLGRRVNPKNSIKKYYLRFKKRISIRKYFRDNINKFDIVWTTSEIGVREIGDILFSAKKHIMQLMELVDYVPLFGNHSLITFPIEKFAQKAYKVVVPEYNRAHIVKIRWNLDKLPNILPNKPYFTEVKNLSNKAIQIIEVLKNEKRKIILYQGGFTEDRRFEEFIEAIEQLGDKYVFYIMGKKNEYCEKLLSKYPSIVYVGSLNPPEHLVVAKYAYIGVLTYIPVKTAFYSELNALYCAPNKIYEYALHNLPMIGTDVPGLTNIFEKYNIGVSCKELTVNEIKNAIRKVDTNYEIMRSSCAKFYNDTNLIEIMREIIGND
ncbi:glycosyltransferase [Enterococcus cecorum]|uniref:glycosyltransferase n=1 Tax=Enterococcus cecorum TaxID=44008 RepID=UPI00148B818B|nr:glycosyltransferase [Enterococcus cecorum]MCJ0566812.1 glycosyltransferase [Enterococcus cecorum]